MLKMITTESAGDALRECGYRIKHIRPISEGSNHYVFDVILEGDRPAICKFAKTRETEEGLSEGSKDTLFGGTLSLEREAYLFRMIKAQAKVPTPEVYGIHDSSCGRFILLERMTAFPRKNVWCEADFLKRRFLTVWNIWARILRRSRMLPLQPLEIL